MEPTIKDVIAGLRAEAKHFRELAAGKRQLIRELKARPIGSKDPIGVLKAQGRLSEYVKAAQDRDARVAELRLRLGQKPKD
jgi:hypothetical protein